MNSDYTERTRRQHLQREASLRFIWSQCDHRSTFPIRYAGKVCGWGLIGIPRAFLNVDAKEKFAARKVVHEKLAVATSLDHLQGFRHRPVSGVLVDQIKFYSDRRRSVGSFHDPGN